MAILSKQEYELKLKDIRSAMYQEALAFPDSSPTARENRVLKAEDDFKYFMRTYLPHYFDTSLSEQHNKMCRAAMKMEKQVLIVAAGGWGKSTIVTLAYALYCILFVKHRCIVVGSMTEDIAGQATQLLKLELEDNDRIRADFGNARGKYQWSDNDFVTSGDVRVVARGAGQAFRGIKWRQYRPSLVILDDIEDEEIAISSKRVSKTLNWIHSTVRPRMAAKNWQLICVANLMGRSGVVGHMLYHPDYISWDRQLFPCYDEEGKSTWPQKWPTLALKKLAREIGAIRFAREMKCQPIDDTHCFRPEMTHWFDVSLLIKMQDSVGFVDPSVLESTKGDFKAIVRISHMPNDHREYVTGCWIRHGTTAQMVGAAYQMDGTLPFKTLGLESNGFQKFVKRDFDEGAMSRGRVLPIKLVPHSERKDLRIERLAAPHDNGDLVFCREIGDTMMLLEQLYAWEPFGSEHDDGPDGLSGAMELRSGRIKRGRCRSC
jgi:hypothetical protein